ncbi:MAG TPA: hypothetical protein VK356_01465, partial [Thermomicrobiales bacterium]|nr:hypothetical protein [Thermomicrobiales bacterium]
MTTRARTAHHVAVALTVMLGVLAIVVAGSYLRENGGLDLESGSNDLMTAMLVVLGFVLAVAFAVLGPGTRHARGSRPVSIVWTLALLAALLFTWHVIIVSHRWEGYVGTLVTSPQEVDAFIADHPDSFAAYEYRVPTGIFLQSFEFLNSNNVKISGFIWQTYGPEIPEHIQRGIVLPEADEAYEAAEVWRIEKDGTEQIGWYFSGEFRQNFDYRLYPFDRQDIWLRLWPLESIEGVVLVPDFGAYRDLTPSTLPGLDSRFVFGGWDPMSSEFSYDLIDYNTDFGLGYGDAGPLDPELYFNFSVARDFLGPMLEHLVLEGAIAILLFFLLLLMAHDSDLQARIGLTIFDLIVASGGLLFAVILD